MADAVIDQQTGNPAIDLALDTIKLEKQALVFTNTKMSAEKTAEDIGKKLKKKAEELEELALQVRKALPRPTRQCERLAACIQNSVAFHHAGLTQKQRTIVEDNFRKGLIRVIACTPSLAMGVDIPAFRSIIRDLRRFTSRGLRHIPVLEYLQMAGRAGRPKYDKHGEAIVIAASEAEKEKLRSMYIEGEPEEIYSKLAVEPVLRTYVLSLIAANFVRSKDQITGFFEKTFWAHQYEDIHRLEMVIEKMLELLKGYGFIASSEEEFVSADSLSGTRYRATKLGRRVAEIYLDPLTAHELLLALEKAESAGCARETPPIAYLHMISSTLELRPRLRVKVKEYDKIQERFAEMEGSLLIEEPSAFDPSYDEYMNSFKTALFFDEWIDERDEEYLLEKYSVRPGETRAKLDIADWLLYSCIELSRIMGHKQVIKDLLKLRLRLKYGVKEELLPLLRLRQVGRVRARALYRNNIRDIGALKKASVTSIAAIIKSRKIAEGMKEQLGQKTEPLSIRKRKGQKGLG